MPKPETIFECEKCGAQFPKWIGRCSECGAWSSVREEIKTEKATVSAPIAGAAKTVSFADVSSVSSERTPTGINEVDRVIGGGLVLGEVILLCGEPGNGKSTLAAQIANELGRTGAKTLYVSGEESVEQVKMRLDRIGADLTKINFLGETDATRVAATITNERPSLAIIDSIQTMKTPGADAGSLAGVRSSAAILTDAAKKSGVPTIIIGQVTKEGSAAGPKSLEHLVDVNLSLEGDRESQFRVLRAEKNRFGSTEEVGVFVMKEKGLKEVPNPSELFVRERSHLAGSAITAALEGSRVMLVEVQALVHPSSYSAPVRRASGFDLNRLQMIVAVLSSRGGLNLGKADVHINIVGGIKLREPAADLAVAIAIYSAAKNKPLPSDLCAFGEVGLGGELRTVRGSDRRITEALRFGLKKIVSPPDSRTIADALKGLNF